ncbi:MAG TPA: methylated-DNA--[protein]-cysteine S-methyltransferase [Bryobacteraceae bacterium]|nr:methylated-DNA--[protein]-cysteine S-methyltransferase [Bryobacteraceae bacterium]
MDPVYYTHIPSPVGRLLLAGTEGALSLLSFTMGSKARQPDAGWIPHMAVFRDAKRQLEAYFSGKLQQFELNLAPEGTSFQRKVWQALREIPYGSTISYGELAKRGGNARASRAVGLANGANPIAIIVPCHRVIGSTGKLTGFGGGLDIKQRLLDLEQGHRLLV